MFFKYITIFLVLLNLNIVAYPKDIEKLNGKSYQQIAETIKNTFDSALYTFNCTIQGHYSSRMYRLHGNENYLYSDLYQAYYVVNKLQYFAANINEDFIHQWSQREINNLQDKNSNRSELRSKVLISQEKKNLIYILEVLNLLRINAEYGLYIKAQEKLIAQLKKMDIKTIALDPEIIKAWGPQIANIVF